MGEVITPELTVDRTRASSTFLMCVSEHGYADADIPNPSSGVLNFTYLSTDPSYQRQGIATELLTSTIRGASTLDEAHIERVRFCIVNPAIVSLVRKVFNNNVKLYEMEEDMIEGANEIDFLSAELSSAIKLDQFDELEIKGEPAPKGFDPAVYAMAELIPSTVATWVMPTIDYR